MIFTLNPWVTYLISRRGPNSAEKSSSKKAKKTGEKKVSGKLKKLIEELLVL